jgi:hypothetical protein
MGVRNTRWGPDRQNLTTNSERHSVKDWKHPLESNDFIHEVLWCMKNNVRPP